MIRMQTLCFAVFAVTAFGNAKAGSPDARRAVAACSTVAGPSRRLELADGRIVSVDVQSIARAGEFVLALGRHAYVFPATANSRTSPGLVDSILGVLIDGRGRATLVSNPASPRTVLYSRAVAMPNGSFAVLYATSAPEGLLTHTDTATLWYTTMRNGRWGASARVASLRTATLDRASALLQQDGQLVFVYPFRDDRRHDEDGGAVLLRQRVGSWTFDTLRTETEPTAVAAVFDPTRNGIVVALAVGEHRLPLVAQRLLLARFGSSWNEPVAIAGDGIRPIAHPSLTVRGRDLVAAWLTWPQRDPATGSLHWLQLDGVGRTRFQSVIDSGAATFPYELVMSNETPLWLYHGEPYGAAVKVMMASDSAVARLPDVKAEFWNPSTKTIALSGSRFLVFTQRRAQTETEPMAASFTTPLEIRCPRSAQR